MTTIGTRDATNIWTAGFLGAAALHGILGNRFAAMTSWGSSEGWQREIAIWNVGMMVALLRARKRDPATEHDFLASFTFMGLLLGANHLAATLRSPRSLGNWLGVLANATGVAAAVAARR